MKSENIIKQCSIYYTHIFSYYIFYILHVLLLLSLLNDILRCTNRFLTRYRTTTTPSPLNLLTTWITYFCKLCKKRFAKKKQRPSLMHLMGATRLSPRSRMGAKWLSKVRKNTQVEHKDSVTLSVAPISPLGSQLSFTNTVKIDNVVDWEVVRRKYRDLYGEEIEKPVEESKESTESNPLAALEGSSSAEKSALLGA